MVRKNNFIDIIISDVIMDLGSLMELTVHSSDGGVASIMEMVSSGGECLLSKYSFHERWQRFTTIISNDPVSVER